jgi:hypothetical protein
MDVEEAKRGKPENDRVRTEFQLGEKHRLILANVLWPESVRTAVEVLAEVLNSVDIRTDRCLSEVAAVQFLNHELT